MRQKLHLPVLAAFRVTGVMAQFAIWNLKTVSLCHIDLLILAFERTVTVARFSLKPAAAGVTSEVAQAQAAL